MKAHNGGQQDLLPKNGRIDYQPEWFISALAHKPADKYVDFRGKKLHYLEWPCPHPNAPSLVLIHGNGAHAHWFDFIAPLIAKRYHIIAPDLPGMGDSAWLDFYDRNIMAEGVITMVRDAGFKTKPALVAHSYGGYVGLIAAHLFGDDVAALLICDYAVRPPEYHEEWFADTVSSPPMRVYDDFDTALARFRLLPEQPCANEFILDHIGALSLCKVKKGKNEGRASSEKGGWTWKFDPTKNDGFVLGSDLSEILKNLRCGVAVMFGEHSREHENFPKEKRIDYMHSLLPTAPFYEIPGAAHHIMLDRPHAFAAAIATQMAVWEVMGYLKNRLIHE